MRLSRLCYDKAHRCPAGTVADPVRQGHALRRRPYRRRLGWLGDALEMAVPALLGVRCGHLAVRHAVLRRTGAGS